MSVRKSPPPSTTGGALTKRARVDDDDADNQDGQSNTMTMTVASSGGPGAKGAMVRSVVRTSGLQAPIVSLGGAHRVSREGFGRCRAWSISRCMAGTRQRDKLHVTISSRNHVLLSIIFFSLLRRNRARSLRASLIPVEKE